MEVEIINPIGSIVIRKSKMPKIKIELWNRLNKDDMASLTIMLSVLTLVIKSAVLFSKWKVYFSFINLLNKIFEIISWMLIINLLSIQ